MFIMFCFKCLSRICDIIHCEMFTLWYLGLNETVISTGIFGFPHEINRIKTISTEVYFLIENLTFSHNFGWNTQSFITFLTFGNNMANNTLNFVFENIYDYNNGEFYRGYVQFSNWNDQFHNSLKILSFLYSTV